jgi:hypothetical protein
MAVNRERKMVSQRVDSFDVKWSSLASIKAAVDEAILKYGPTAEVEPYSERWDETEYLGIFMKVPETDGAMADRILRESMVEAAAEKREAAEFQRLMAKYGTLVDTNGGVKL